MTGPSWHPPQSHLLGRYDWRPRVYGVTVYPLLLVTVAVAFVGQGGEVHCDNRKDRSHVSLKLFMEPRNFVAIFVGFTGCVTVIRILPILKDVVVY